MADSVDKRIQDLQISIKQFQLGVKDVVENGEKAKKTYKELLEEFNKLTSTAERLVTASKNSFSQTKDSKQYLSFLTKVNTGLGNISSSYKRLEKTEKQTLSRRQEIQKKWDDRRFQRTLSRLKKEQAERISAEKKVQQRREAIQKKWDDRKRTRENSARKKRNSQRVADERKVQKQLEAEEKKRDFKGGFRGQLTPRAIGGALGSLTKYLGLYQAINAAQRLFTELTIGSAKQAIAFEKSLANLGAVAGASSEEVAMLGKNALEVAGSTKFTAEEIVGLQTELSKLGFTADDVVASTQAIAFTAQALGAPLDAVAQQTGKVINQFDLLIEQAGFVGDVLVTAINNSALSFDSFSTAIQYVGPIAKNLGLTFEQTAGAMAVLADNGFTASRIGTGLRGIFTELGKTSADVESSLKSLAEQNISLSEAVDLVGKRNAAQLITLLKNIDAIDKGNTKYYQQGRALESAAKQANSFSGQMEILTSNFREFQIEIGNVIVESDLLLSVLDEFFPKGAQTARAFKTISEIGFESFNDGAQKVSDGADATDVALEKLGITLDEFTKSSEMAGESWFKTWTRFFTGNLTGIEEESVNAFDDAVELTNKVIGLRDKLQEQSEEGVKQKAITEGQTIATNEYEESVRKLTQAFEDQINVNDEVDAMARSLTSQIEEYQNIIDSGTTSVYNFATGRYDMLELTEEEILKYKGLVGSLQGYLDQLTNISFKEEDLSKKRESEKQKAIRKEKEDIKERIKIETDATKELISSINERAKQQTAIAEGTAEKAEIEAKRQAAVSDAYKETAKTIAGINVVYDENKSIVDEAVKSNEKLAEVLGSEVIQDLNNAFKGYSSELTVLKKALDDGTINQENYDNAVIALRNNLINTIGTFKAFAGTSPELNEFFDNLLMNFDVLIADANAVDEAMSQTFGEALKTELIDSLDDALNTAAEAIAKFNDVALENTKNRLDSEKSEIKNRYDIEQQILESQLNNQLITESQFRAKQKELQRAKIAEENNIDKQIFQAEQKQDKQDATTDYLKAIASIIPTLIAYDKTADPVSVLAKAAVTGALATASYGAELSAIGQRKFFPKKFAKGGMVNGPSHAQGGVPFSIQGRNGYEMEGGEYIINKESTVKYKGLLDLINGTPRPMNYNVPVKFAAGGMVTNNITNNFTNESVDYLKAIAEATVSTAIGVSKPVRAYVADKDLRTNNTERRIRDRNDRI